MPHPTTTPTLVPATATHRCPHCHHVILRVAMEEGEVLHLDTSQQTYVITTRETRDRTPIVVPSRGYPVHALRCFDLGDSHA